MKDRIKQCRITAKYSQKYVAISVGVATPTVSMWESGAKTPSIESLAKLADLFGTTVDYLIGRTDQAGNPLRVVARQDHDEELLDLRARVDALERAVDHLRLELKRQSP